MKMLAKRFTNLTKHTFILCQGNESVKDSREIVSENVVERCRLQFNDFFRSLLGLSTAFSENLVERPRKLTKETCKISRYIMHFMTIMRSLCLCEKCTRV